MVSRKEGRGGMVGVRGGMVGGRSMGGIITSIMRVVGRGRGDGGTRGGGHLWMG